MARGENPVLATLLDINAVSLERIDLDPQSLILVRLAALIAVDAPVSSYLLHLGAGAEAGLTPEQARAGPAAGARRSRRSSALPARGRPPPRWPRPSAWRSASPSRS